MFSSITSSLLDIDGTSLLDQLLEQERSEVVVQCDEIVIKLLIKYSTTGLNEEQIRLNDVRVEISQKSFHHEKEVYHQLSQNNSIVTCLNLFSISL